jgi:hypothetical protein
MKATKPTKAPRAGGKPGRIMIGGRLGACYATIGKVANANAPTHPARGLMAG